MDDARWVGTEPPSGEFLESRRRWLGWLAERYANAVLDAMPHEVLKGYLEDYRDAREWLATCERIYGHMWRDGGRDGRFAGWLVRDDELVAG